MRGTWFLWIVYAISLMILAQGAMGGTFLDDFSDGLGPDWVQYIGNWEVQDGRLLQLEEGDKWQRLILDKIDGKDYSISNFTIDVECGVAEGKVWVGIAFLHDPALNLEKPGGKHYTFGIVSDGRNIGRIYKSAEHGDRFGAAPITLWVEDAPQKVETGKTYTYKLDVSGKNMKAYVNGSILIDKTDEEIHGAGKVGLFCTGIKPYWLKFSVTSDSIPNSGEFAVVKSPEKLATSWGQIKNR